VDHGVEGSRRRLRKGCLRLLQDVLGELGPPAPQSVHAPSRARRARKSACSPEIALRLWPPIWPGAEPSVSRKRQSHLITVLGATRGAPPTHTAIAAPSKPRRRTLAKIHRIRLCHPTPAASQPNVTAGQHDIGRISKCRDWRMSRPRRMRFRAPKPRSYSAADVCRTSCVRRCALDALRRAPVR
jgi:hypothetical protein